MYRIILLILFLISAVGCNSGSNSDHKKAKVQPPIASNVFSQVVISDEIKNISLKKQIRDPQGLPLELLSVKPETEGCPEPLVNAKDLSYSIDTDSTGTCLYKYTVKNISNNSANDKLTSSENFVLISDSGVEDILPAISRTASTSTDVNIDLKSELGSLFPDDYILDEPITVFGTGIAEVLEPTNGSILFHASDKSGIVRLLYSISNDSTLDVKAGYIDISVSGDGNIAPTAKNDTLNSVKVGTDVVFDIHDLIEDADSDPLQLIDVYSVNNVAYIKDEDKDDINNTKFIFHSDEYGKFDVSYVIDDHRGGFAVGVISFNVGSDNVPWNDITEKGQFVMTTYTAPITEQFARTHHIKFNETYEHVVDGVSYDIALMNFQQALAYCSSKNLDLPLSTLDFQSSIKRHIPDGSSLTDYYKWPENINYFTTAYSSWEDFLATKRDPVHGEFGYVYCSDDTDPTNMWDEGDIDPNSNDSGVITCTRMYQEVATLEKDHAYVSDVNDDSNPKIYNTIKLAESPIGNESVQIPRWTASTYVYSDSPSISFDSNNVPAVSYDSSEPATIKVYSRKAGQFVIKSVSRGQITETRMYFDEDSVSALSIDSDFKLDMTKTKQLTVTSEYSSGKTVDLSADDVTFESSNPEIATVNAAGLVTAVAGGSATITATLKSDETLQATTNVDVNAVKYKSLHLEVVEEDRYTTRDGSFHLSVTDENGNDVPWDEIKFLKDVQDSQIHISATGVVTADVPADEAKNTVIGVALKADETMVSNYRGMFFGPTETVVGIENYSTRSSGPHPDIYRFKDTYTSSDLSSLITPVESGDRVLLALSRPSYAPSIIDTRCSDVTSSNPDVVDVRLGEGGCILEYKSAGKAQVCGIMDGERRCVNIDT